MIGGNKQVQIWAKAGTTKIWESYRQQLLGIYIDRDLKFNHHMYIKSL